MRRRGRMDPEYELEDTGIFHEQRYFDVFIEYAKNDVDDILIRVRIVNRGPEKAELDVLAHALVSQHVVMARNGATG